MGTLRVRNLAQKILWEEELTGQLSDGRWENSRPHDHWEPWCDATVVIDPDHVGRDFWVRRDGYCFTERDLLDILADRMLGYVRLATGNDAYAMKDLLKDLRDIRKIIKTQVPAGLPVPPQPEGWAQRGSFDQPSTVYVPPLANAGAPARTYTMADFDV